MKIEVKSIKICKIYFKVLNDEDSDVYRLKEVEVLTEISKNISHSQIKKNKEKDLVNYEEI